MPETLELLRRRLAGDREVTDANRDKDVRQRCQEPLSRIIAPPPRPRRGFLAMLAT